MADTQQWVTSGFDGFSEGRFGNAGQNMYVSRAGVLQRIHHFDLDDDGYVDLLVCNSQDHSESPPTYVYQDVLGEMHRRELPAEGAVFAELADLNGDGYDDLVLSRVYDGIRHDLNAIIYYGSPDGLTDTLHQRLPAPRSTSVAAGDFTGDGRPDLAFTTHGRLRVFSQTELGFEPKRYADLGVACQQLTAADIDGDGYDDLLLLGGEGEASILWGGADGLDPERASEVPTELGVTGVEQELTTSEAEAATAIRPLARVVLLGGVPHLFIPHDTHLALLPVMPDRSFGEPLTLGAPLALAVDIGDVNGDGHPDLAVAARSGRDGEQCSWVYWGGEDGFSEERRQPLIADHATDVAVGDLDGDGCDDVVICCGHTAESFTSESLVFAGGPDGAAREPVRLTSHDARRVVIGRTSDDPLPQVIFANRAARGATGDVDPFIYHGGPQGFDPERRTNLSGRDAVAAAACDVNDDGYPDAILANCSENAIDLDPGSFVFLGGPDGYSYEPDVALDTTRAHGVVCADFDRDGYLDLILGGFNFPDLLIFHGGPDGFDAENPQRIRMEIDGVTYDQPRWLYTADLDNDDWLDLIIPQITSDRSIILWGSPEGFSIENRRMLSVFHGAYVQAADLTGNGYLDLMIGGHAPSRGQPHDSFVYVYWNGPEGLREERRMLLPSYGVNALAVADLDGDGNLDLVVCNYHSGTQRDIDSYIYWGQEDGTFSRSDVTRLPCHSASGAVAADFDGNGTVDLFIANHKMWKDHVGRSFVWWNDGTGFSRDNVTELPTNGPHGTYVVDAGNQLDRGHEEYYISAPFRLPPGATVRRVSWDAEVPDRTWVRAQLRFAESEEGLEQARWQGPGEDAWFEKGAPVQGLTQDRWVQYRLALGALWGCRTPRVTRVVVDYGH
ncbi:MAG: FG-GAP repeat domain-containing protein [Armatimonadota bacterium]